MRPEFILVIPTLGARGLVFRLLSALELDRPVRLLVDDRPGLAVAEKWNAGLDLALEIGVPAIFLNDDILPWPGALATLFLSRGELVTGETTVNLPRLDVEPQVGSRGGFALFLLAPTAIQRLEAWERERWPEEPWEGYRPGRFDQLFAPAYFEDSDLYYRLKLAGVEEEIVPARYYHELTAGPNGGCFVGCISTMADPERWKRHRRIIQRNGDRYLAKWGGKPGEERFTVPFDGKI